MSDVMLVPAELKPVNMYVRRCWTCGRFWALETFAGAVGECPMCSRDKIADLNKRIEHEIRVTRALRGALNRRRKR